MIKYLLTIIFLYSGAFAYGQISNTNITENSIQNKLTIARNSMDTVLYEHLFNWFLSTNDGNDKNKSSKAQYIYTPVLEIDEDCFINLYCNYKDEKFLQCVKPVKNSPYISALYSYDGVNWDIITFNGISWYTMKNNLVYTNNYPGIKITSIAELKENVGFEMFLFEGFYCKVNGNSIQVYLGSGKFADFTDIFGPGKPHSARFAFGCK